MAQTQKSSFSCKICFSDDITEKVGNKNEADIWFPLGSCEQPYGENVI